MSTELTPIRTRLREALRASMRERDRAAMSTYRTALSAIDNAEAVPLSETDHASAIETASVGVGSSEAARRELSEADQRALVARELDDLHTAGHLNEANLLRTLLT